MVVLTGYCVSLLAEGNLVADVAFSEVNITCKILVPVAEVCEGLLLDGLNDVVSPLGKWLLYILIWSNHLHASLNRSCFNPVFQIEILNVEAHLVNLNYLKNLI